MDPATSAPSPLRHETPASWVALVLTRPKVFLNDHAHLERKAATNALELIGRWPFPLDAEGRESQAEAEVVG